MGEKRNISIYSFTEPFNLYIEIEVHSEGIPPPRTLKL